MPFLWDPAYPEDNPDLPPAPTTTPPTEATAGRTTLANNVSETRWTNSRSPARTTTSLPTISSPSPPPVQRVFRRRNAVDLTNDPAMADQRRQLREMVARLEAVRRAEDQAALAVTSQTAQRTEGERIEVAEEAEEAAQEVKEEAVVGEERGQQA